MYDSPKKIVLQENIVTRLYKGIISKKKKCIIRGKFLRN